MNVIVIACNGLHLGFLGPYGNGWIETPNLDRLAAEGVVFDHHFPENLTTLPTRRRIRRMTVFSHSMLATKRVNPRASAASIS